MNGKITLALALGVVTLGMLAPAARADLYHDYRDNRGDYRGGYRDYRGGGRDSRRTRLLDRVRYLQNRVDREARQGDVRRWNARELQDRLRDVEISVARDRYISDREYDRCDETLDWVEHRIRVDDRDHRRY